MSQASLLRFLGRLSKELESSSDIYRSETANKQRHTFHLKARGLGQAAIIELQLRGLKPTPKIEQKIYSAANAAYKAIDENFLKLHRTILQGRKSGVKGGKQGVSSRFKSNSTALTFTIWTPADQKASDIFNRIPRIYKVPLQTFFRRIGKLVGGIPPKGAPGSPIKATTNNFFNLGHHRDTGVVENQMASAVNKYLNGLSKVSRATVIKDANEFGIDLKVVRDKFTGNMRVFLQSRSQNAFEGVLSRSEKLQLRKDMARAISSLRGLGEIKGSDSTKETIRKKTIKEITDPFKKVKGVKVKTEDIKRTKGKTTAKISKTVKVTSKTFQLNIKAGASGSQVRKNDQLSIASILGLLNLKMHDEIKGRMVAPALVYRTGEFAESVRVTGITETPGGYPSISFTYQNSPYGIFDFTSGTPPWNTPDRDPNILIDQSIRDILKGQISGRLYTRRVWQ